MDGEVLKMAVSQGLGYSLFVWLFFYTLKKQEQRDNRSEKREGNYQGIVQELTSSLSSIEDIKCDVKEVKDYILKK
ncbi:putative UviB [Clostridium putrefaciens]|uniref:Putative UviB n=1 Tax=Clostridium putrefaciens TaxID=99675 RepID=A0A381J9C6_9CLOT|nr:BhlA/UviB family holin-like peptide [Clostridium putrefaciens]SUY47046.1 putative UviB [Clostridium putrefaciens]